VHTGTNPRGQSFHTWRWPLRPLTRQLTLSCWHRGLRIGSLLTLSMLQRQNATHIIQTRRHRWGMPPFGRAASGCAAAATGTAALAAAAAAPPTPLLSIATSGIAWSVFIFISTRSALMLVAAPSPLSAGPGTAQIVRGEPCLHRGASGLL